MSLFAATIGLVSGVLFGTVLINWAVRKGIVTSVDNSTGEQSRKHVHSLTHLTP